MNAMQTSLTAPNVGDLSDIGFVNHQLQIWATRAWALGLEHIRSGDSDAAARVTLALLRGTGRIAVCIDLDASTATFVLNLDNGTALELFASVPTPKSTPTL